MAIKGSLREASLPDVLQLLAMGQKSGCLSVTDRSNFGYIFFERGRIIYAAIVNRRDRLGDLLVKNELLDAATLARAVEMQGSQPEERLGEILIEMGAITREQLEQYIRIQIEEAVYFLFTWSQGSFYFEAGQEPDAGAMRVSINPENLLLEGARRIDEWSLIEKKIPSLDLVFELDRERIGDEAVLTDEQRRTLSLVDARRTVHEIVHASGLVEFDVAKALFGLIQAGFAHQVGRRVAADVREVPRARIDEHRNLGVAFYKTGMHEEAAREFRRVLQLHPEALDARFALGLIALRSGDMRGALRAFRETVDAGGGRAAAFHNLALALEELEWLPQARGAADEALRLEPSRADVLLSCAVLRLKAQDVEAAVPAFEAYRAALGSRTPPAVFFAFAILAEAAAGRTDAALRLGDEGIALYPHSAPLLLHLGLVRERRGDWDAAEALYRRAAEEGGGEVPQVHKGLGDVLYRRGAHDEAAAEYGRAIRMAPELGDDVYFKLGNIHYKRMEREEAVRLWRRALELNPANHVARTNLELVEHVLAKPGAGAR